MTKNPKNPGRPAGSPNKQLDQAQAEPSRCKKCGSSKRGPYKQKSEQAFAGTDGEGQPFTHIIRRRTVCLDCGQHRVDRTLENRHKKTR